MGRLYGENWNRGGRSNELNFSGEKADPSSLRCYTGFGKASREASGILKQQIHMEHLRVGKMLILV
jgi:hypothetical protein